MALDYTYEFNSATPSSTLWTWLEQGIEGLRREGEELLGPGAWIHLGPQSERSRESTERIYGVRSNTILFVRVSKTDWEAGLSTLVQMVNHLLIAESGDGILI